MTGFDLFNVESVSVYHKSVVLYVLSLVGGFSKLSIESDNNINDKTYDITDIKNIMIHNNRF